MKIVLQYANRTYGNEDLSDFTAEIKSLRTSYGDSLTIDFTFKDFAQGRGANWENRGWVEGALIHLSPAHARKLATTILWALEQDTTATITQEFLHTGTTKGD